MTRLFLYGAFTAVVAVATACGSVKQDEQPADAAIDSPPPAPVKLTALSTTGDGLPDPTSIAIFVDNANNVVKDGMVDGVGQAEAMLPMGGTVHVIKVTETGMSRSVLIQTFKGVKPGDDLTSGLRHRPGFRAGASTGMNGTFSSAGTGYSYVFYNDCGAIGATDPGGAGTTGTVAPTFNDSCHDDVIELLGVATSGTVGANPRFIFTSFNHAAAGSFTVPNNWQTMQNFNLTASNVPDEISSLSGIRYSYLSDTSGLVQAGQFSSITGDPPAGNNSMSIPYPQGVGPRALILTQMSKAGTVAAQELWTRTSTLTTALTVDATALPLPWITQAPTPTATGVSWAQDGNGTPDLRIIRWLGFFTLDGFTTAVTWYIADDGSGGPSVTLPTLPAAYVAYDPGQQTTTPISARLLMIDRSDLAGYDQARPNMYEYTSSFASMGLDTDKPFQLRNTSSSSVRKIGSLSGN